MTPTQAYLKNLDEIIEARKKATPGKWINAYPNAGKLTPMPDHIWTEEKQFIGDHLQEEDATFIALAANEIERLAENQKVLIEALEFECGGRCAHQNPCNAREALEKVVGKDE